MSIQPIEIIYARRWVHTVTKETVSAFSLPSGDIREWEMEIYGYTFLRNNGTVSGSPTKGPFPTLGEAVTAFLRQGGEVIKLHPHCLEDIQAGKATGFPIIDSRFKDVS